jgi:hypothetical protein
MMRSYHDTAYDGLFQTQKGWGSVSAPPSHSAEIIEILSDLRKGSLLTDESPSNGSLQP